MNSHDSDDGVGVGVNIGGTASQSIASHMLGGLPMPALGDGVGDGVGVSVGAGLVVGVVLGIKRGSGVGDGSGVCCAEGSDGAGVAVDVFGGSSPQAVRINVISSAARHPHIKFIGLRQSCGRLFTLLLHCVLEVRMQQVLTLLLRLL